MVDVATSDDFLDGTGCTKKWIVEKLKKSKNGFAGRLAHSEIKEITAEHFCKGVGYTSKLYRVTIRFNDESKAVSVVLKVPNAEGINKIKDAMKVNENNKEDYTSVALMLIDREARFYSCFSNCKELEMPEIYDVQLLKPDKTGGIILMEDLSDKSLTQPMEVPFSIKQILSMLKPLIKLSVLSLKTDEKILKQFARPNNMMGKYFAIVRGGFQQLLTKQSQRFESRIKLFEKLMDIPEFVSMFTRDISEELGIPHVLVHGDIHARNIMWRRNEDDNPTSVLYSLKDWQAIHLGDIGCDIAALLVLCTTAQNRKRVEAWVFDYYHALLKSDLIESGKSVPFTPEKIKLAYEEVFVRYAMLLPSMTMILMQDANNNTDDNRIMEEFYTRISVAFNDAILILFDKMPAVMKPLFSKNKLVK